MLSPARFQYLHRGHRNILEHAAKLGEVTVLLNSDKAIEKTKNYLAERCEVRAQNLINTGLVRKIVIIETDPTEALKAIRPDYQVVGSDYTYKQVMQKGGKYAREIVIVPYTKGISSSQIYRENLK